MDLKIVSYYFYLLTVTQIATVIGSFK